MNKFSLQLAISRCQEGRDLDDITIFLFCANLKLDVICFIPTSCWVWHNSSDTLFHWVYFQNYFCAKDSACLLVLCSRSIIISIENISSVSTNCGRTSSSKVYIPPSTVILSRVHLNGIWFLGSMTKYKNVHDGRELYLAHKVICKGLHSI